LKQTTKLAFKTRRLFQRKCR